MLRDANSGLKGPVLTNEKLAGAPLLLLVLVSVRRFSKFHSRPGGNNRKISNDGEVAGVDSEA